MKRLVVVWMLWSSFALGGRLGANLIASDDFEDYTPGSGLSGLNGGAGFTAPWVAGGTTVKAVVNGGLVYSAGQIQVDGGSQSLQITAADNLIDLPGSRAFAATSAANLYLSFLYQETADTGGSDFLQVGFSPNGSNPTLSVIDNVVGPDGIFHVRAGTAGGNASGVVATTGITHFLVLKIANTGAGIAFDRATLYANPTSAVEGNNASVEMGAADVLDLSSSATLALRRAFQEAGDQYRLDAFRIGEQWEDVVPVSVPEPTALSLVGMGLFALLIRLRGRRMNT